ncbi:platelet glycoprotein Ib beta chain [Chanos chanos]|uniref:Platelet glycoprotein Ib beta chain n=1 Tax=Chanos chanos TaxID=29144 RepID=A0A6J2UYA2_CHACN|nr:platelet glycoprotein Ib beta chain [Chanos chanos]
MKCVVAPLFLLLSVLGIRAGKAAVGCPGVCSCRGTVVDCSGRQLTGANLPSSFPPDTTEIRLHDNHLTTLPNGLLDSLPRLRVATLHGNPWTCDCGVLYLRGWLLKQSGDVPKGNVTCSSPPSLRGRLVMYLVEEEVLNTCHYWLCDLALTSQISLVIFIIIQVLLLATVILFLRRFNRLSREARRTAEESFTGGEHVSPANEYVMLKDRDS